MTEAGEKSRLIADLVKVTRLQAAQIRAAVQLLDEGNTIPFITRYRKEQTLNLSDGDLRLLNREKARLQKLYEKQADVLRLLAEHQQLTAKLEAQIRSAETVSAVDELYRPFRPKRRTRATIAREQGLEPLARLIQAGDAAGVQGWLDRQASAADQRPDLDAEMALSGAADILAEELSDRPPIRSLLSKKLAGDRAFCTEATSYSQTDEGQRKAGRYKTYLDYHFTPERLKGYQVLALRRAEQENLLKVSLKEDADRYSKRLCREARKDGFFRPGSGTVDGLQEKVAIDSWKRLLKPSLITELKNRIIEKAEAEALQIFADNLSQALLAPPLRNHSILAFDPGFRNGCKLAVTNVNGALLEAAVIYPVEPQKKEAAAAAILDQMLERHPVSVLALGNGTATRETEAFIRSWQDGSWPVGIKTKAADQLDNFLLRRKNLPLVIVDEAGASVYSASAVGAAEFPDLAVELRSAVSLARRLQDPLAELVKIDPEAIGVGQYQHDMNPKALAERLNEVVEAAVNQVGADLNTASSALLSHIAGLNRRTAESIVHYRQQQGAFKSRSELLKVDGLGPKSYLQCAGFLRVPNPKKPLDNTFIHPESYELANRLLDRLLTHTEKEAISIKLARGEGVDLGAAADRYSRQRLLTDLNISPVKLQDLLSDLAKAGRDDRGDLELPSRSTSVTSIADLKEGMVLKGTVRNVVQFGAFVDVGVHQDGLIHISEMADRFVSDPSRICRVGQVLDVKVLSVDQEQGRIALSLKGI